FLGHAANRRQSALPLVLSTVCRPGYRGQNAYRLTFYTRGMSVKPPRAARRNVERLLGRRWRPALRPTTRRPAGDSVAPSVGEAAKGCKQPLWRTKGSPISTEDEHDRVRGLDTARHCRRRGRESDV